MSTQTVAEPDIDVDRLRRAAAHVLLGNWTGGSTVPSRTLYPHQWSWDSAFVTIGLRHLSPPPPPPAPPPPARGAGPPVPSPAARATCPPAAPRGRWGPCSGGWGRTGGCRPASSPRRRPPAPFPRAPPSGAPRPRRRAAPP